MSRTIASSPYYSYTTYDSSTEIEQLEIEVWCTECHIPINPDTPKCRSCGFRITDKILKEVNEFCSAGQILVRAYRETEDSKDLYSVLCVEKRMPNDDVKEILKDPTKPFYIYHLAPLYQYMQEFPVESKRVIAIKMEGKQAITTILGTAMIIAGVK